MATQLSTTCKTIAPLSLPREGRVFVRAANGILGTSYELSVVFIGNTLSKRLNATHRGKNKSTNVLAFPLSKTSGEIYINIPLAKREARRFESTAHFHICFLFVHGLLHLRGYDHGPAMEQMEKRFMKKYFSKAY